MVKIGIDTNIFIYFFDRNPEFGPKSKIIFDLLAKHKIQGITSIISLIGLLSLQKEPEKIAKLQNLYQTLPNLSTFDVTESIGMETARIRRDYGFRTSDAIQLATAIIFKADKFITNDKQMKKFKELEIQLLSD